MPNAEDLHGNLLNENNNIKEGQVFWFYILKKLMFQ